MVTQNREAHGWALRHEERSSSREDEGGRVRSPRNRERERVPRHSRDTDVLLDG